MQKTKEEILNYILQSKERFISQYGIEKIGIFGSYSRGSQSSTSDLDVIVEFKNPTFDNYMDLKFELEDALQIKVDLVISDTIKPRIKSRIEQEVLYV